MESGLLLGCIADDFTGASDAASFLKSGGLNTILLSGVPRADFVLPAQCNAAVIALKTRTQETGAALADSLAAIDWLERHGAKQYYVKYCSTFDSTPAGNIGPIVDAVMEHLHAPRAVLCPALPVNGRIVEDGILYVNGLPLAQSPMKDHPLTPMWASRIAELMRPQGKYDVLELSRADLSGAGAQEKLNAFAGKKACFYVVPDYTDEDDAEAIVDLFGEDRLLTGGSGLLASLARRLCPRADASVSFPGTDAPAVIVSGSCSAATHAQTLFYQERGGASLQLNGEKLSRGMLDAQMLWNAAKRSAAPVLVYAYASPDELSQWRGRGDGALAALIEQTLADVASLAFADGVRRIIAAGGETSGAVTQRLGYDSFWIGESVAPGVPVLIPLSHPDVRLVLKSGNFGREDFFLRALSYTGGSYGNT